MAQAKQTKEEQPDGSVCSLESRGVKTTEDEDGSRQVGMLKKGLPPSSGSLFPSLELLSHSFVK